jgi:BirA family biotin operon repressor/biotin-[acetyl-CoA-carboxylase] ligase
MIRPDEEWQLDTRRLGRRVLVFERAGSTNTLAAFLADDEANDGLVVLAREQTAGRGQHGRSWQCPPGAGVLMSVLLFPPPPLRRPALLTAWAAVSVCETIRQATGQDAGIKWPNDVFLRGKKVCGILIEQGRGTVAGIGLNVAQSAESLARAGLPLAGSLACFTDRRLDPVEVFRLLVAQLDAEYDRLCRGDIAGLESSWKGRLGLLGRPVVMECLDGVRHGRLRDLSFAGVELELPDGGLISAPPELVRHISTA